MKLIHLFVSGTFQHETAAFIRRRDDKYIIMWFQPNRGQKTNVMNFLRKKLNAEIEDGYNALDGNVDGICSQYVWYEFIDCLIRGKDPHAVSKDKEIVTFNKRAGRLNFPKRIFEKDC